MAPGGETCDIESTHHWFDMENVASLVTLVILVLVSFPVMAMLYRKKKGRFEILRDDSAGFEFETDLGLFSIDRNEHRFHFSTKDGREAIALSEIERLNFGLLREWAFGAELLTGLQFLDLFKRYRDTNNWYQISLVLVGGPVVPLFVAGQYEPREFLRAWWFDFQVRVLHRLGLFEDVEDAARSSLTAIQGAFEESGNPLRLS
jgi:hypothetical protein